MYMKLAIVLLAMAAGALAQTCECNAANMEACVKSVLACDTNGNATRLAEHLEKLDNEIKNKTWECKTETESKSTTNEHPEGENWSAGKKSEHHKRVNPLKKCAMKYKCKHERKTTGTDEKPHEHNGATSGATHAEHTETKVELTPEEKQQREEEKQKRCECIGQALGHDTSICTKHEGATGGASGASTANAGHKKN